MTKPPFDQVVSRYGPVVLRVCRAAVGRTDADDVWSETFLAALDAYPKLADDANIEAWIVTIAHRKAIDLVRKSSRSQPHAEVPVASTVDEMVDPDLARALAALPEKQRVAVAYHYLAGLPYREIAELIGGTEAAARRAAADGIAKLRNIEGALE